MSGPGAALQALDGQWGRDMHRQLQEQKTEQKHRADIQGPLSGLDPDVGPSPGWGGRGPLSSPPAFWLPTTLTWLMQLESLRLSLTGL